jgi:hypothetical protein
MSTLLQFFDMFAKMIETLILMWVFFIAAVVGDDVAAVIVTAET